MSDFMKVGCVNVRIEYRMKVRAGEKPDDKRLCAYAFDRDASGDIITGSYLVTAGYDFEHVRQRCIDQLAPKVRYINFDIDPLLGRGGHDLLEFVD